MMISTHTPTQGVTHVDIGEYRIDAISTHTPTQGVTRFIFIFIE